MTPFLKYLTGWIHPLKKYNYKQAKGKDLLTKTIKIFFLFLILQVSSQGYVHANLNREVHTLHHYHFSTPVGLESKVEFWKKIYSEYSTDHYVVHDMDNLSKIYEVVYIKNGSKCPEEQENIGWKELKESIKNYYFK